MNAATSAPPSSDTDASFASLGVPSAMTQALDRQGVTAPFPIQAATIPDALSGRDVLGRAPTGSGKTLAFGIPLLAGLSRGAPRRPRGLILSPTRELAEQIRRELDPLAEACDRSILTIYGGVGFGEQLKGLRRGADLLVACPGRLEDLISQGEVTLSDVNSVVVDEADRMADMGFLPAVRRLLDLTAAERQTVLFSATLDTEVQVLIDTYQSDPVTHQVGEVEPDLTAVDHRFILTEKTEKLRLAADLVEDVGTTMIFCRTRHGVDRVARQLKRAGVKAGWIHGGRSQNQRNAALHAFTAGKVLALVATDVAARGIHVDGVAQVIHYDPPADHKDYIHRSGRTARAGAGGVVVSFVNHDQRKQVGRLVKQVGLPATEFEPTPELRERAAPAWEQRPQHSANQKRSTDRKRSTEPKRSAAAPVKSKSTSNKPTPNRSKSDKPNAERGNPSKARARSADTEADDRRERRSQPGRDGTPKPKAKGRAKTKTTKRSGKPRPKHKRSNASKSGDKTSGKPAARSAGKGGKKPGKRAGGKAGGQSRVRSGAKPGRGARRR